jgi:hypothetical protein
MPPMIPQRHDSEQAAASELLVQTRDGPVHAVAASMLLRGPCKFVAGKQQRDGTRERKCAVRVGFGSGRAAFGVALGLRQGNDRARSWFCPPRVHPRCLPHRVALLCVSRIDGRAGLEHRWACARVVPKTLTRNVCSTAFPEPDWHENQPALSWIRFRLNGVRGSCCYQGALGLCLPWSLLPTSAVSSLLSFGTVCRPRGAQNALGRGQRTLSATSRSRIVVGLESFSIRPLERFPPADVAPARRLLHRPRLPQLARWARDDSMENTLRLQTQARFGVDWRLPTKKQFEARGAEEDTPVSRAGSARKRCHDKVVTRSANWAPLRQKRENLWLVRQRLRCTRCRSWVQPPSLTTSGRFLRRARPWQGWRARRSWDSPFRRSVLTTCATRDRSVSGTEREAPWPKNKALAPRDGNGRVETRNKTSHGQACSPEVA